MGGCASCGRPPATTDGDACGTGLPHGAPAGFEHTHRAIRLLGRGAFADTWLFWDVAAKRNVAVKLFKRPIHKDAVGSILREIGVQAEIGPSSVHLIEVYEAALSPSHLAVVMEVGAGGSLTSYVGEAWAKAPPGGLVLRPALARYLFRQFVDAVAFCHSRGVAHRDLKLDNTLLDGADPPCLKLCDFGFAARLSPALDRAFSHLGTPEYMSPELLRPDGGLQSGVKAEAYDPRSCDVWAAGVFLCVALLGAFPFDHTREAHLRDLEAEELDLWMQEVGREWFDSPFLAPNIGALPPAARDLLDKIFRVDPAARITLPGIMAHPWYAAPLEDEALEAALAAIDAAQAAVDTHVAHRRVDARKVAARMDDLKAMLDDATRGGRLESPHLRPLHQLSGLGGCLSRRVDLTEASVLADGFTCACSSALMAERGLSRAPSVAPAPATPFAAPAAQGAAVAASPAASRAVSRTDGATAGGSTSGASADDGSEGGE